MTGSTATTGLYFTRVTHLHRLPVHHYGEHRSYSWYVDVDALPRLPWWLRPFARFEAVDHLHGSAGDTLRERVDSFLGRHGLQLPGGRTTALLMPRVLGRTFAPLSLFWCHDAHGVLRAVIAEVTSADGRRNAYLLPPGDDGPVSLSGAADDGYYLLRVPRPGEHLDLTLSLHRNHQAAMVATWRGERREASLLRVLWLQLRSPLAPHRAEWSMRLATRMIRRGIAAQTGWRPSPAWADRRATGRSFAAS